LQSFGRIRLPYTNSPKGEDANISEKIVQLNEEVIKNELKELVRRSVEETLNNLLDKEAQELTNAARYERTAARQGYRAGHYDRNLTATSGDVTLESTEA